MALKSLLLCSDEKIVRVLRRVLGDLDIEAELCPDCDTALRKLTRQRFEAIIVNFADEGASAVLGSVRSAPCNRHAIAIAIVEPAVTLKSVFGNGAHFVLYMPVSSERAKSTFRAARALMKSERRRNARIPVQIPIVLRSPSSRDTIHIKTIDLCEGGMAVALPRSRRPRGTWQVTFTLPGSDKPLVFSAEFAWEGSQDQAGLRFVDPSIYATLPLREWLKQNSPDAEQDDPPIRCRLTHLSLGGCYLEASSPFPVRSRVMLSMKAVAVDLKVQGVVRVMHPDKGMGVEFAQVTSENRSTLEKFLALLAVNPALQPEVLVQPDGMEPEPAQQKDPAKEKKLSANIGPKVSADEQAASTEIDPVEIEVIALGTTGSERSGPKTQEDPLLQLFARESLAPEAFHEALREHRAKISAAGA
jgi:hypothetical protein